MSGTDDTDETLPTDASLSNYVDGLLSSEEAEEAFWLAIGLGLAAIVLMTISI